MSPEELENQIRILSRILDETTAEKINLESENTKLQNALAEVQAMNNKDE